MMPSPASWRSSADANCGRTVGNLFFAVMSILHPNAQRVVAAASEAGVSVTVVEYPAGTRTAVDAAAAIECVVDQIVKSMVFVADGEIVLALTSGLHQVDTKALAAALGADRCRRADADRVREATGYPIGGVPPFGHTTRLRSVADPHLLGFDVVWAAGGTPRHVFAIPPADLVALSHAVVTDFTKLDPAHEPSV